MSTSQGQPGLSSEQRSTIRSTILSTRQRLEGELRRQLEKYGIHRDKKLPLKDLSHLSLEDLHIRRTLNAAIERELESTEGDLERSITNYVHESTKTYLNQFVALKIIEVRGLVEETITERPEYGNRSYMHYTLAEIAGELTNAPDDGFGAALDLAYQEIGAEIRMIFEESEHTVIDLDPQVREKVLNELDAITDEAWKSDEALGWVYQYFGEEEREEIDERVDEENYKIAGTDIATKTQLFTPRYIVEWMVDNSLGRLWLEMRGERTNIDNEENCFYLAPLEDSLIDRKEKPVEEITVLDPACGSGHMLFYAFEVLYQMYLEEGEVPERYIPREILRNNLYAIDIDSGAAQIAALSLYLIAKEKSPKVPIPQLNVVSADAVLINGDRKQDVLKRARSELERDILDQIWTSFDNIREFGSLVRIEERVDEILEDHRDALQASGQVSFTEEGAFETQSAFVSESGAKESWQQVKSRLLEDVRELATEALDQSDPIEEMFANEVGKTVELLDLLVHKYEVVITNPPYLGSAKMSEELKNFISDNYLGSRDLYSAFIERAWQFTASNGYSSLVTPENYMFIASFTKLREKIISDKQLIEGMHLSRYGFDQQKDAYTIPFVLRNSPPSHGESLSRFFRMTHEQPSYETYEQKITGLNNITSQIRESKRHSDEYIINQNTLESVRRSPFVYWFGEELLDLFKSNISLGDVSDISGGVKSGDNDHFLRKHWEVPRDEIGEEYNWFVSNGNYIDYYDRIDTVIDWESGGENIKAYAEEHEINYQGLSNTDWYFEEAVIYRKFSREFVAKYIPEGCIFSSGVYRVAPPEEVPLTVLLGYMNSSLYRYLATGINPTLNFNPGDAGAAPFKTDFEKSGEISKLVKGAIKHRKEKFSLIESGREFSPDKFNREHDSFEDQVLDILYEQDHLDASIIVQHSRLDQLFFDEFGIGSESRNRIHLDLSPDFLSYPLEVPDEGNLQELNIPEYVSTKVIEETRYDEILKRVKGSENEELKELAADLETSPFTIVLTKYQEKLYDSSEAKNIAARIISYLIGERFGRWDAIEGMSDDISGILLLEDEEVEEILHQGLPQISQSNTSVAGQINEFLGEEPLSWLRDHFFSDHHCKEYRRRGQRNPIYWHLESPKGFFSCLLYYHEIDRNTLPKLRGQYLDPRIEKLKNELDTLTAQTSGDDPSSELLSRKEEVQNELNDIGEFRDTIDRMIDDGITIDLEEGIWENIKIWDRYEILKTGLPKLKSSYSR